MRCFCGAPGTTGAYWKPSLGLCAAHALELAERLDATGRWPAAADLGDDHDDRIDTNPWRPLLAPAADADQLVGMGAAMLGAGARLHLDAGVLCFTRPVPADAAGVAVACRGLLGFAWHARPHHHLYGCAGCRFPMLLGAARKKRRCLACGASPFERIDIPMTTDTRRPR